MGPGGDPGAWLGNGGVLLGSRKHRRKSSWGHRVKDDFLANIWRIGSSSNREPYSKPRSPMARAFLCRRDYKLHKVSPVKSHQPDRFVPNEENMDLLTTYRQDYNPYSACRVAPIRPRDSKYPDGDKMECLPTYKGRGGQAGPGRGPGDRVCGHAPCMWGAGEPLPVGRIGAAARFCMPTALRLVLKC